MGQAKGYTEDSAGRSGRDGPGRTGEILAVLIITLWAGHLALALLTVEIPGAAGTARAADASGGGAVTGGVPPEGGRSAAATVAVWGRVVFHMLVQAYLYTGLFITAHDAMHGSVSRNRKLNRLLGRLAAFLFAAFSYKRLHANHMKHHRWPGEDRDPDFSPRSQSFLVWFVRFFAHYVTIVQILIMAAIFNLLNLVMPTTNVILFWMIPAFLGTFQLFYFGTYRPHRYPHTGQMQPHRARSQRKNHLLAMLSCYFFGYHYEHHASPGTPWWGLARIKGTVGPGT